MNSEKPNEIYYILIRKYVNQVKDIINISVEKGKFIEKMNIFVIRVIELLSFSSNQIN